MQLGTVSRGITEIFELSEELEGKTNTKLVSKAMDDVDVEWVRDHRFEQRRHLMPFNLTLEI